MFTYCEIYLSVLFCTIQSKFDNKHRKILSQQMKERVYKNFGNSILFIPMFYFRDTGLGQYQIFFIHEIMACKLIHRIANVLSISSFNIFQCYLCFNFIRIKRELVISNNQMEPCRLFESNENSLHCSITFTIFSL